MSFVSDWVTARKPCGPLGALGVAVYRFGNRAHHSRSRARLALFLVLDVLVIRALVSARLPAAATIGQRIAFPHDANGVVLHPAVVIGDDVKIFHGVTLGTLTDNNRAAPVIGDRVLIGAGACVLGGVTVGADAKIGANAVVLTDVPAGATAVGVPARIIA